MGAQLAWQRPGLCSINCVYELGRFYNLGCPERGIFGPADLRYLLEPPENPCVRHVTTVEELGWYGQRRMAQSVVENRDSAFKAAHDVSKLHTVAVSDPSHGWVRCRRAR
jgi:hypothetical protein